MIVEYDYVLDSGHTDQTRSHPTHVQLCPSQTVIHQSELVVRPTIYHARMSVS